MIVTFCGHSDIFDTSELQERLKDVLKGILKDEPSTVFYLGDYGSFDGICNYVLKQLQKEEFPFLRRIFVTPYMYENYGHFNNVHDYYDEVLYPFEDKVLPRFAISKRNQWMVDKADYVIAYVDFSWGGAVKTLEYAKRKKKPFINLGEY